MKKRRIFRNLNDKEFAWVLYDVGNSAYTMLACALIPIWFKAMAIGTKPGQLTSDRATAYYSMAIAVITIVVALLGPVCGAISDYKGMKKIFFTSTVAVGVCGCILNGFACQWIVFLLLFAATKIFSSGCTGNHKEGTRHLRGASDHGHHTSGISLLWGTGDPETDGGVCTQKMCHRLPAG